jgi:hypothetical protein
VKILYTGFSARECGDAKRAALRWDMDFPIVEAAKALAGDGFERRRVILGEDLSGYDLIVLVLNQALSFNTRHGVLGALWAAQQTDTPIACYVGDWQQRAWISHLNTIQRKGPTYLNRKIQGTRLYHTEDEETTNRYADQIMAGAARITNPWPENWQSIIATFGWGDWTQFTETLPQTMAQVNCVDFSPFGLELIEEIPELPAVRQREWLLPSLSPQDKWVEKQGITWPVNYLGSRKLKAERVTEQEVLNRVNLNLGTLSPRYTYLMGSGWWRIRYVYTALTGSIIAGDPKEAGCLGPEFQYTPAEIEQLSDAELTALGPAQKAIMESTYWPAERSRQEIRDVMKRVAG